MSRSYYYSLTSTQNEYLRRAVEGRVVVDLGCGSGELAMSMSNMGAKIVHAVDKSPARIKHPSVVFHQSYFAHWKVPEPLDVAVISWPQNYTLRGLIEILSTVPEVIYLGKNTEGSACGTPPLFSYLASRNTVRCVADRRNTLIHYVSEDRPDRTLHHEEMAALNPCEVSQYDPSPERRAKDQWKRSSPPPAGACS